MKNLLGVIAAAAMLSLAACGGGLPQVHTQGVWDDYARDAAQIIHEKGDNAIMGQAFLRQQGGDVVTCAGSEVYLFPRTSYATERMSAIYGTARHQAMLVADIQTPMHPEYEAAMRETVCDAGGNFSFEEVADGSYFVQTAVFWRAGYNWQGGSMMSPVVVAGGETKKLVINP